MEPSFDVTSLHNRRAVNRWERTSVGDLLERVTWSWPDKEAMVAADGACADPASTMSGWARTSRPACAAAAAICGAVC